MAIGLATTQTATAAKLRVLARGDESAVETLEAEGLATRWDEGRRRLW